jgi:hypothetical protein
MEPLTLEQAIAYSSLGYRLAQAFRGLKLLPVKMQRKGNPMYDEWFRLACEFNKYFESTPIDWRSSV